MPQMKQKIFKRQITILFLGSAFFLLASMFIMFFALDRIYRTRITEEIETMSGIISQNVDNFFKGPEQYLLVVRDHINEYHNNPEEQDVNCFILDVIHLIDAFEEVYHIDERGIVLNTWPFMEDYQGIDFSNQDYFKQAMTNPGINWADSFISSRNGLHTVALSTQAAEGIVVIFYNLKQLSDFVSVKLTGPEEFIAIMDTGGNVVAHTEMGQAGRAVNLNAMPVMKKAYRGEFGTSEDYYADVKGLASVHRSERSGFYILLFRSYGKIFDQLFQVYTFFIIVLAGILVLNILLVFLGLRNLFRPVSELEADMAAVAEGSYSRVLTPEYKELQSLTDSFATMVSQVREREKALIDSVREKETLLRELYHRTKNNMQIIISLMRLYKPNEINPASVDLMTNIEAKISSISLIHEKLYRSSNLSRIDFKDYLADLIPLLTQTYRETGRPIRYELEMEELFISIDFAVPCGLVFNELITNSVKYAFGENEEGLISIACSSIASNKIEMSYRDNGGGLPDDFDIDKSDSLGFTIIQNIVEHQLEGSFTLENNGGFACRMVFTVDSYSDRV